MEGFHDVNRNNLSQNYRYEGLSDDIAMGRPLPDLPHRRLELERGPQNELLVHSYVPDFIKFAYETFMRAHTTEEAYAHLYKAKRILNAFWSRDAHETEEQFINMLNRRYHRTGMLHHEVYHQLMQYETSLWRWARRESADEIMRSVPMSGGMFSQQSYIRKAQALLKHLRYAGDRHAPAEEVAETNALSTQLYPNFQAL